MLGVATAWGQAPRAGGVRLGQFTWQSTNQTDDLRLENGLMKGTCMGFDPYIEAQANLDAGTVKTLSIKMAITGGSDGQVYWSPASEERSIKFTLIPDARMHTYIVPVATVATWRGRIGTLRFDPCSEPLAKFEIASIEIGPAPQPKLEPWYLGPDEIVMLEGASLPLSVIAVNTGGTAQDGVSLSAGVTGAVTAGAADAQPVKLAVGEKTAPRVFTLKAGKAGAGGVKLSIGGQGGVDKAIAVTVVAAPAAGAAKAAATNVLGTFAPEGSSEWIIPHGKFTAVEGAAGAKGIAVEVDGQAQIVLGTKTAAPSEFVVTSAAKGNLTAMVRYEDAKGNRFGAAYAVPAERAEVRLPVSPAAGEVTVTGIDVMGKGTFQVFALQTGAAKADAPSVVLHGKAFFRNESPAVEGYIAEIRTPFALEIKGRPRRSWPSN